MSPRGRDYHEAIMLGVAGDGLGNVAIPDSSYVMIRPYGMHDVPGRPDTVIFAQNLSGKSYAEGDRVEWIWLSEGNPSQAAILGRRLGKMFLSRFTAQIDGVLYQRFLRWTMPPFGILPTAASYTDLDFPTRDSALFYAGTNNCFTVGGYLFGFSETLSTSIPASTFTGPQPVYCTTGNGVWTGFPDLPPFASDAARPSDGRFQAFRHNGKAYALYKTDRTSLSLFELTPPSTSTLVQVLVVEADFWPHMVHSLESPTDPRVLLIARYPEPSGPNFRIFLWDLGPSGGPQVGEFAPGGIPIALHIDTTTPGLNVPGYHLLSSNRLFYSADGTGWAQFVLLSPLTPAQGGGGGINIKPSYSTIRDFTWYFGHKSNSAVFGAPAAYVHYGPADNNSVNPRTKIVRNTGIGIGTGNQEVIVETFNIGFTGGGTAYVAKIVEPNEYVLISMTPDATQTGHFVGGIYAFRESGPNLFEDYHLWAPNTLFAPDGAHTGSASPNGSDRFFYLDAF